MTENLDDNYKIAYDNKAGFGKSPALVMVDFAQGYFDPDCVLYAGVDDALASEATKWRVIAQHERQAARRHQSRAQIGMVHKG